MHRVRLGSRRKGPVCEISSLVWPVEAREVNDKRSLKTAAYPAPRSSLTRDPGPESCEGWAAKREASSLPPCSHKPPLQALYISSSHE